ncbi:amidohydrolase family protein [Aeoliella mucimassa]|uniref:Amidohydrolase n=1 Tax=Aeoliella mucimassa TaxID=2527972 RepID=A0A518AQH0_9BACT|nr:amidohydrolase family protein [Aeoliella mucimassa]QDU56972.1 Amidohydrolase [Aeoliella mucimassa]
MIIDAHHHFWNYTALEFGWISDSMSVLANDYLPPDLSNAISTTDVDRVLSVQARQSTEETTWLLDLAAEHEFVCGVVGWLPLVDGEVAALLERFSQNPWLRGIRHIVHDEPDDDFILNSDFNRGVSLLAGFDLTYDILIFERHLPLTIQFVDDHSDLRLVLDHIAKPRIADGALEPWRTQIVELARRPNVYCKVSGMVTEADCATWSADALRPYFDVVLEAFGPQRLMFGSDWPVCLLASDYAKWFEVVRSWTAELTPSEQQQLFSGTAIEAYQLQVPVS